MTTYPDTPDPRAGTPTPAPMSEARMALLRSNAVNWLSLSYPGSDIEQLASHVVECLDEITRLHTVIAEREAWIRHIAMLAAREPSRLDGPEHNLFDAIEAALAGEAVPE